MKTIKIEKQNPAHTRLLQKLVIQVQELFDESDMNYRPDYVAILDIADELAYLDEFKTCYQVLNQVYDSIMYHNPKYLSLLHSKLVWQDFIEIDMNTFFGKFLYEIEYFEELHCTHAYSYLNQDNKTITTATLNRFKNVDYNLVMDFDHEEMIEAVSAYRDTATKNTCDTGEHIEITQTFKFDVANMSLRELVEAYISIGGKPIIYQ